MTVLLSATLGMLALSAESTPSPASCTCAGAIETHGWCEAHDVGYVGSVEIESRWLYDALDAHGHDVDHGSFECDACQEAIASDGFCDEHRIGFVEGQAYFSMLTYQLTRGELRRESEIECSVCRSHSQTLGWCDACGVGHVGPIAIATRDDFDQGAEAIRILHVANEAAKRCERCAVAIVTDTWCPVCKITYKDGVEVDPD